MVTIAGIDRGLNLDAIERMELGQLVDYTIEYNNMHEIKEGPSSDYGRPQIEEPKRRKATQADIDAFWG